MGQTSPQGSNMQQGGYVFVPVFPIHGFYQQDPTMPYPNNQQQQWHTDDVFIVNC